MSLSAIRSFFLVALAACTLPGWAQEVESPVPAPRREQGGAPVPAPRFVEGDAWRYQQLNGWNGTVRDRHASRVIGFQGDEALLGTSFDLQAGAVKDPPVLARLRLGVHTGTTHSRAPFAQVAWMQFPLEVGKTWSSDYSISLGHGKLQAHHHSAKVVGWESVTVPAGTFRALRVNHTLRRMVEMSDVILPEYNYYTFWYVPEVKRYVKYEREYRNVRNARQDHFIEELLGYAVKNE